MGSDLSQEAILRELTTRLIGRTTSYYPTVSSTMDVAREAAARRAAEGTVVVAEEQTGGRGRLGRSWINPPGVLAVSVVLRPAMDELFRIGMVSSLATSRCVDATTGLRSTIKWPNDVLLRDKKVSGILMESSLRGQSVDWVIVGIGLNIDLDPSGFPEIADTATSIAVELGHEVSHLAVLLRLLDEFDRLYLAMREGQPVHEEWRDRLETLGKTVTVTHGGHVEVGRAESVDANGSLILRRLDGSVVTIIAGDVTLRTR
jgi:BirA family biotin operon repressor/biotin-[acetyl-CoA-carboxylase] ligase